MPTALIVEDEPAANQLLSMLVQLRGYATDSAFSGGEAVEKASEVHPDLVFLDLMLPDIDGYEVCETIKGRRSTTDIPVVMVTARAAGENRLQGFRSGASEYIAKPYMPDQIFAALAQAEAWRRRAENLDDSGSLSLDAREDVAHFRHVNDLRTMLLDRSDFAEALVNRMAAALAEILQRGVDWGRRHGRGRVADLTSRIERDRFSLTLRDESGWLADDDPRRDGLALAISQAGFDEVDFLEDCALRMSRSLPQTRP